MKTLRVSVAFLFFILFFIWASFGKTLMPVSIFFPQYHLTLFIIFTLFILIAPLQKLLEKTLLFIERKRYLILIPIAFFLALGINLYIFKKIPHIQDGLHYLYMAETFASGKLSQAMPYNYEFFEYIFMMVDGKRHFSLFMPGYSFFLVPFALFGITFIANPILTGLNIFLVGRFSEYLFGKRVSLFSMLLFVISPFMLTLGGTWMAHPFTAALTIIAIFSYIHSLKSDSKKYPVVTGLAIGWLMMTRPQNALFITILLGLITLLHIKEKGIFKKIVLFAAGLTPWLIILLAYNYHFTGDPLFFIQDMHFDVSEPRNACHKLGIGTGCPHCNGQNLPLAGLTWWHAVEVSYMRLSPLVLQTFSHPIVFIFIPLTMLFSLKKREESRKKILLSALFLVMFSGYFFFYFNGNVYGPRYLYEGTFFLIILMAKGVHESIVLFSEKKSALGKYIISSLWIGTLVFQTLFILPQLSTFYSKGFWGMGHLLKEEVEKQGIHNSVIFTFPFSRETIGCGFIAMDLSDFENSDNIFVKDLGDKSNSRYMHFMKGRKFYKASYLPWKKEAPVIEEIKPIYPPGYIHIELEDKLFPYSTKEGQPDYCNSYPPRSDIHAFLDFPRMDGILFSKRALFCRFKEKSQRYTFGQHFLETGHYKVDIKAISGSVMGQFSLKIDSVEVARPDFTGFSGYHSKETTFFIDISKGFHNIVIEPIFEPGEPGVYFLIDYIKFEKK